MLVVQPVRTLHLYLTGEVMFKRFILNSPNTIVFSFSKIVACPVGKTM